MFVTGKVVGCDGGIDVWSILTNEGQGCILVVSDASSRISISLLQVILGAFVLRTAHHAVRHQDGGRRRHSLRTAERHSGTAKSEKLREIPGWKVSC